MIKIKKITDIKEFHKLKDTWNNLLSSSTDNHIHLTHEWCSIWLEVYGKGMNLFILIAEDETGITGIAPLVIRKVGAFYKNSFKFRQIIFIGSGFTDRSDFIISKNNETTGSAFLEYIFQHNHEWDELYLWQLNSGTKNFKLFENLSALNSEYETVFKKTVTTPFLKIEDDFELYLKNRAKLFRKQLRMYKNNLTADGKNLEFQVVTEIREEHIDLIRKMADYRREICDRRNIFLEEKKLEFIRKMIPIFNEKKYLILFLLNVDGTFLSYDFTFSYNKVIYDWNTSYNPDYKKYSPGRLLNKFIIEYCFENGYEFYDFMAGDEEYKMKWTKDFTENYSLKIQRKNIRTFISRSYKDFKKLVKH